jgi:hypothetical protein
MTQGKRRTVSGPTSSAFAESSIRQIGHNPLG